MAFPKWLDVGGIQMNYNDDFREWLNIVRFSRNVCMLIPMEACIGYPLVVEQGVEYLIPFFRIVSNERTNRLSPPFAYLRVSYPASTILTFNNLCTLPEWKEIEWDEVVEYRECSNLALKINEYYNMICCYENAGNTIEQLDEMLLNYLDSISAENSTSSSLVIWYKKLIEEAKKYR